MSNSSRQEFPELSGVAAHGEQPSFLSNRAQNFPKNGAVFAKTRPPENNAFNLKRKFAKI
jgi:hypothetical protein